jgi:riboflavin biosynthesis pyrimidine reductase
VRLSRLHPGGEPVTAEEAMGDLRLAELAGPERPYVIVNFVASLDGRATVDGRSAGLSDEADRRVFHLLRTQTDAVMAGTRTMATERYGRMVRDPGARGRRAAAGLPPDPAALLVTRSGAVPWEIPLFEAPAQRVHVFSPAPLEPPETAATVDIRSVPDEGALGHALRIARTEFGVRSVLCEGGPRLFSALLRENLADELFLTVAPQLSGGGEAPAITAGPALASPLKLELVWALEAEGTLFLRYRTGNPA